MALKQKIGQVISNNMQKTVVVKVTTKFLDPTYKKVLSKNKKYLVHNPDEILNIGDIYEDIHFYKKELKIKNENIYQANILDRKSKNDIELIHTDGHINYPDSFFDFINCGYFSSIQ